MSSARYHFVTLRHKKTRKCVTTSVRLTDAERNRMIDAMRADGSYDPNAPVGMHVESLPSAFAIKADVVNVQRAHRA